MLERDFDRSVQGGYIKRGLSTDGCREAILREALRQVGAAVLRESFRQVGAGRLY